MEQLTREELRGKITTLRSELSNYEIELKRKDNVVVDKFKEKMKSMVGGYYMRDFYGDKEYYRIDSVISVECSETGGIRIELRCAVVCPDYAHYYMQLMETYFTESEIYGFELSSKEEFDAAVKKLNKKFNKELTNG